MSIPLDLVDMVGLNEIEKTSVLAPLTIDDPLFSYGLKSKATSGNKLAVKAVDTALYEALLGTVEFEDGATGQIVEKTFTVEPSPAKSQKSASLPKPTNLVRKTAAGDELFDDPWILKAYKAVDRAFKRTGTTAAAMQETFDLFVDRCTSEETSILRGAVAALDMTSFLRVFSGVLRRI
jgi:hypothetical protein